MVERLNQPSGEQEFNVYREKHIERTLARPEYTDLNNWYQERLANLGEIEVTRSAVTGAGGWNKELTPEGEVDRIAGAFFTVDGFDVIVRNPDGSRRFGWHQPGLVNAESPINLPSPEGNQEMNVSGFVGVIMDPERNVLLTVTQEPLADTPKRALARTPFQTSATKLQGLLDGKDELDPTLADLLKKVGDGKAINEMFASGDVDVFPLALADANRISATNIGFGITIQDETLRDSLAADGRNRWCNNDEVRALKRAGLLNSHTASAIDAALFNLQK